MSAPCISSLECQTAFPATIPWSEFTIAVVESAESIEWIDLATSGPSNVSGYPRGTAFGPSAELRWFRRSNGLLHFVLLSDTGARLGEGSASELLEFTEESRVLLWGEPMATPKPHYYEGRIPKLLQYPGAPLVPSGHRLAFRLRHYVIPSSGVRVSRHAGFDVVALPRPGRKP